MKDYKNKETLEQLYLNEKLSTTEIGEICDCSQSTIRYWMDKHDIDRRPVGRRRVERASYFSDTSGYELWCADNNTKTVGVSQLTAIAHGADPHDVFSDENEVHHRNTIQWDNRPDNLQVVSKEQHRQIHRDDDRVFDEILGCEVLDDNTRYGRTKRENVRSKYANPDWYLAI